MDSTDTSPLAGDSDILLNKTDLPLDHPRYLKMISEDEYNTEFGSPKICEILDFDQQVKRLVAVIPLYIGSQNRNVIPVPCIVDTGAPKMLYLGKVATQCLESFNCLGYGTYANVALGKIHWRGRELNRPYVDRLPERYEIGDGDVRTNLIGLGAMNRLGMLHNPLL